MTSKTTNKLFAVQGEIKDRQVSDGLLSGILWRFLTGPFIKRFLFGVFGIIAIIIHGITGLNLVVSIILFCGFIVVADVRGFFRKLKEWIRH